jgi:drug/metabolite transporter (DMT)-like permease
MGDWEKTYYNNLMGMPIQTFMAVSTENTGNFVSDVMLLNSTGLAIVLGSCVMGFGISLFGTICRNAVSATAFNILGNLNKFATIAFSAVFLGSRNSPTAISGLILSLVGGAVYSLGDVLGAPSKKAE